MVGNATCVWRSSGDVVSNLILRGILGDIERRDVRFIESLQDRVDETRDVVSVSGVALVDGIIARGWDPIVIEIDATSRLEAGGSVDIECETTGTFIVSIAV